MENKTEKNQASDQNKEPDVMHTPGGEMPDVKKQKIGKEVLTEEDEKKAS